MASVLFSCSTPKTSGPGTPQIEQRAQRAGQTDPRVTRVDGMLATMRPKLHGYSAQLSSEAEREELIKVWRQAEASLQELERASPNRPDVEWRLGELYRFGHQLDIPDAGERCVAHLERAIALRPEYAEAYLELGVFYADAGPPSAALATRHLRKAIELSGGNAEPRAWRALAFAYYYEGSFADAVESADHYLRLAPEDDAVRRLRDIARQDATRAPKGPVPAGRATVR